MNWPDERYVRLYTRDTPQWRAWCWQARALLPLLLRAADRAGVIATGSMGAKGVAAVVALPLELVVVPGLDELLEDGCVTTHPAGYLIRNFIEAQEAARSSKARMADTRARRALGLPPLRNATDGDETQLDVANEGESATNGCASGTARHGTARHGSVYPPEGSRDRSEVDANDPADSSGTSDVSAGGSATGKRPSKSSTKTAIGDWAPSVADADHVRAIGLDPVRCADKMRAWAESKGAKVVNWDARFRQWAYEERDRIEERQQRNGGTNGRPVGPSKPHAPDEYRDDGRDPFQ